MNENNRISKVLTREEMTSVQQCLTTLKNLNLAFYRT